MKIHSETKESPRIQQEEDGILGEMDDIDYDRTNKSAEGTHDSLFGSFAPWCTSLCMVAEAKLNVMLTLYSVLSIEFCYHFRFPAAERLFLQLLPPGHGYTF